jgi:hypothetical protein
VQKYDKKSLYLMLAKCYEHLHPFVKSSADESISYEDYSLDIFEQIVSTSELVEDLVKRELLLFKHYQLYIKVINCPLLWWNKYEAMFPTIGFFT